MNLEVTPEKRIRVGFATTAAHERAIAVLEASGRPLLRETVAIDPGKPFCREIALPAGVKEVDLHARLQVDSKDLVAYRPVRLPEEPCPRRWNRRGPRKR